MPTPHARPPHDDDPQVTQDDPPVTQDPLRPPRRDLHEMQADPLSGPLFVPYEQRWTGPQDGRVPTLGFVLDPRRIVPERWADVLRPLPKGERFKAVFAGPMHPVEHADLMALEQALPPPPDELAQHAMDGGPVSLPFGAAARPSRTRQVNVRIATEDHRLLAAAAHIAGTTPTTLSRMLILGGIRKILAEHGRHYGVDAD